MYLPPQTAVEDHAQIGEFVRGMAVANLVTVGPDGAPDSTTLPIMWEGDLLIAHIARNNEHWTRIAAGGPPALAIVNGPNGYVTPSWYASKAEHGRVVPTWNYTQVQLRGTITVHDDAAWVLDAVTQLTDLHEGQRDSPWAVTDAPEKFVQTRLKAIVGLSMVVSSVEAKAKISRDKPEADHTSVLAQYPDGPMREAMVRGGL